MEIEGAGNRAADLLISTVGSQPTAVTVTTPLFDPGFRKDVIVRSRSSERVSLPISVQMSGSAQSNRGINIIANEEISVIGVNKMLSTAGGYLGIPTDALGTEYYAVTHFADPLTSPNANGVAQIGVVATADATTVTFALPPNPTNPTEVLVKYDGNNYKAGDVFSVNLQKFETVQLQSNLDLTATHIYSNMPIGVFSGNMFAAVGSANTNDHLVVQLPPVHSWGRNFVLPFYPEKPDGYFVRIISSEPDTVMSLDGIASVITIDKPTSIVEFALPGTVTSVTTDKPIQIVQLTRSQISGNPGDPSMILIPAIEQYTVECVFQTPESTRGPYTNYLILISPADKINGFRMTGTSGEITVSRQGWQNVQGTRPLLMFRSIPITSGTHRIFHEPTGPRFAAILYGYVDEESYALPLGFGLETLNSMVTAALGIFYLYSTDYFCLS